VANPNDILLWHKAPSRKAKHAEGEDPGLHLDALRPDALDQQKWAAGLEALALGAGAGGWRRGLGRMRAPAGWGCRLGCRPAGPASLTAPPTSAWPPVPPSPAAPLRRIEDLVAQNVGNQLQIFAPDELALALHDFVEKDQKDALSAAVSHALEETRRWAAEAAACPLARFRVPADVAGGGEGPGGCAWLMQPGVQWENAQEGGCGGLSSGPLSGAGRRGWRCATRLVAAW
jgi:hypothetical protein